MRKHNLRILLIDDNEARRKDAERLKCTFLFYDGTQDFFQKLNKSISEGKPDLVLLDHKLDKPLTSLPQRGLSIAQYLREKLKTQPIFGFTVDQNIYEELILSQSYEMDFVYDDTFLMDYVLKEFNSIIDLAEDFKDLRRRASRIRRIKPIMALIDAPEQDIFQLQQTLPSLIMEKLEKEKKVIIMLLAKWIRKRIMKTPGFLYDSLHAATHIGLKEEAFLRKDINLQFRKALYTGLFSKSSESKLWWASELRKIVFKKMEFWATNSWFAGQGLKGIKKSDWSICVKCKKPHPEIVGYIERSSDEKKPLHLGCSQPHPFKECYPLFDEPRIMIQD